MATFCRPSPVRDKWRGSCAHQQRCSWWLSADELVSTYVSLSQWSYLSSWQVPVGQNASCGYLDTLYRILQENMALILSLLWNKTVYGKRLRDEHTQTIKRLEKRHYLPGRPRCAPCNLTCCQTTDTGIAVATSADGRAHRATRHAVSWLYLS